MEKTIEKLRSLRSIVPDAGFASMSKSIIFASIPAKEQILPQTKKTFFYELGISLGVMATAVVIAILLGGTRTTDTTFSVANIDAIKSEALTVNNDIAIALKEIDSFDQSTKKTAMALNEAAANGPSHLNEAVLSAEIESLKLPTEPEKNITELLDQAIF